MVSDLLVPSYLTEAIVFMKRCLWGVPLLIVGCATVRSTVGPEVDLMIYPHFARVAQTLVNPNTLSSVATLDIVPYVEVSSGSYSPISSLTGNPTVLGAADMLKLSQASPTIDPNRPFVIRKLKPNQNYRIWARAYNLSNGLISQDTTSYVDVQVGSNDAPSMANLPVNLVDVAFGASAVVAVQNDGRYDYLKATLSLANTPLAVVQTSRNLPQLAFQNLQGNTNYSLLLEAYKLGAVLASTSQAIAIANETAPATISVALSVPYVTTTLAGSGATGSVDGAWNAASFFYPVGVAVDTQRNLFVGDYRNSRIRKVTSAGVVSTFVGNGNTAFLDGTGTSATVNEPLGLAFDSQGNLYVAEFSGNRIRKITPAGVTSVLAGGGVAGYKDGTGTAAQFNCPHDIVLDAQDNLYVTDQLTHTVRKITSSGVVTTFAGNGTAGYQEGNGLAARLNAPRGLGIDNQGNLYVADRGNLRIRKITLTGDVTTYAGNGTSAYVDGPTSTARFKSPEKVVVDAQGNVLVSEWVDHCIRRISPSGMVTTILGNGTIGSANGTGMNACFYNPWGMAFDEQGNLYIADENNNLIRKAQ